jgi:predicted RNase H-like HicB family nuclease
MTVDAHAYNINIRRGEFDGEILFEARVKEFPDLIEYAESYEDAYALAMDAIETTATIVSEKGRSLPEPFSHTDDYSGRVTLRLSKSLHRVLAEAAEVEGVSLNQHLVNILTYHSGFAAGQHRHSDSPWQTTQAAKTPEQNRHPHVRLVHCSELQKKAASWR